MVLGAKRAQEDGGESRACLKERQERAWKESLERGSSCFSVWGWEDVLHFHCVG